MSCGGGGSGQNTSTVVQNSAPPPQILNAYSTLTGAAFNQAQTPPSFYGGPMVAGFGPQQQQAFQEIQNAQGIANPYINAAGQAFGQSMTPFYQNVGNYESPYTSSVTNALSKLYNQQNAQQLQQVRGNATAAGAYGGDREAVAEALTAQQQNLAEAPTMANVLQGGYQTALGAAEAQGWLGEQGGFGLGNLGQEALSTNLSGANAELQAGGLQQQLAQEQLNIPYEQFQSAQAYPWQTLGALAPIVEGTGSLSGGTSSTSYPGPSLVSQLGGLGIAGLGTYGLLNSTGALSGLGSLFGAGAGAAAAAPVLGAAVGDYTTAAAGLPSAAALLAAPFTVKRGGRIGFQDGGSAGLGSGSGGGMGLPPVPAVNLDFIIPPGPAVTGRGPPQAPSAPGAGQDQGMNPMQELQAFEGLDALMKNTQPSGSASGGRIGLQDGGGFGATETEATPLGATPTAGMSPNAQGFLQRLEQMPMDQLQAMAARMPPSSPYGQLVQRALFSRRITPSAAPNQVSSASGVPIGTGAGMVPQAQPQAQPQGGAGQGAPAQGYASGGYATGAPIDDPDMDPNVVVDHSGKTVVVHYPSEGKSLDLGIPAVEGRAKRAAGGAGFSAGPAGETPAFTNSLISPSGIAIPQLSTTAFSAPNMSNFAPGGGTYGWMAPLPQYNTSTPTQYGFAFPSFGLYSPGFNSTADIFAHAAKGGRMGFQGGGDADASDLSSVSVDPNSPFAGPAGDVSAPVVPVDTGAAATIPASAAAAVPAGGSAPVPPAPASRYGSGLGSPDTAVAMPVPTGDFSTPSNAMPQSGAAAAPTSDTGAAPSGGIGVPAPPTPQAVTDVLAQPLPGFDQFWSRMVPGESGGKDVPNYRYDTGHTASGPAMITDTNWRAYAPKLGIDTTKYPTAMSTPEPWQKAVTKLMYRAEGSAPWDTAHGGLLPVAGTTRGPGGTTMRPGLARNIPVWDSDNGVAAPAGGIGSNTGMGQAAGAGNYQALVDRALQDISTRAKTGQDMYASPWLPVIAMGAGMMASRSPFAGVGIGQGALAGLGMLEKQQSQIPQNELRQAQAASARLGLDLMPAKMALGAQMAGGPAPAQGGTPGSVPATAATGAAAAGRGQSGMAAPAQRVSDLSGLPLPPGYGGSPQGSAAASYDQQYAAIDNQIANVRRAAIFEPDKLAEQQATVARLMDSRAQLMSQDPRMAGARKSAEEAATLGYAGPIAAAQERGRSQYQLQMGRPGSIEFQGGKPIAAVPEMRDFTTPAGTRYGAFVTPPMGGATGTTATSPAAGGITAAAPGPATGLPPGAVGQTAVNPSYEAGVKGEMETDENLVRTQLVPQAQKGNDILATARTIQSLVPNVRTGWGQGTVSNVAAMLQRLGVPDEDIKQFTSLNPADAQAMNKMFITLSAQATRAMGAREPGSVFTLFRSAYPNLESDPRTVKLLTNMLYMQGKRDVDQYQAGMQQHQNAVNATATGQPYETLNAFTSRYNTGPASTQNYLRAAFAMTAGQIAQSDPALAAEYQRAAWSGLTKQAVDGVAGLLPTSTPFMAPSGSVVMMPPTVQ